MNFIKNKKIYFLLISIIIVVVIVLVLVFNKDRIYTKEEILKRNDYQVTQQFAKGTTIEDYTYTGDCIRYDKDGMTIFVFEYENHEMAKDEIMADYEREKNVTTVFEEKGNYIRREIRYDEFTCCIRIAINNYYISSWFEEKDYDKVKKVIDEIIENELQSNVN